MIQLKTREQIDRIREACHITARLMEALGPFIEPGMSSWDVNQFCHDFIIKHKGVPAFLGYGGFPASACISIDEEVIHGIPSKERIIQAGSLVSVDIGINLNGFFSDMARTFIVGETTEKKRTLNRVTEECLRLAVDAASKKGARIQDIGKAVSKHASKHGFGVVRQYCGHGVGLAVHESPEIPNYASLHLPNPRIREGMVLAIEPMINLGTHGVRVLEDEWTVVTLDGLPSSHFEDTVAITRDGLEVLTV
ncbi:MAG TPA: type I methionyl aminopeptidase [Sphaerochaeta sp.]|nr:type I methionyl aminopeptidase [Sphaerochaeta sp.]